VNPHYPIYIISKGRADTRMTSKSLERMKVPYRIVIEPQEYDDYAAVIDPKKILVLPFSNLGLGSIPARNWVWEHSISEGWERHWIMDDNINNFYRLNRNKRLVVESGTIFKCAEDFTDRYENIAISGLQYRFFMASLSKYPAYVANTRIYSCILIKNDIPFRWRGRYNEDTDLSLRVLKAGWCTVQFNAFLQGKTATMTMKGGNTDELYVQDDEMDGRLLMAQSLNEQHPDVARIVRRYGRWHHHVDYSSFKKNQLIRRTDIRFPRGTNNYGMVLRTYKGDDTD
jgi:hypothetical protein